MYVIDDMSFVQFLDIDDMGNLNCCQAGHTGSSPSRRRWVRTYRICFRQRFNGVAAQLLHLGRTNGGDSDDYR